MPDNINDKINDKIANFKELLNIPKETDEVLQMIADKLIEKHGITGPSSRNDLLRSIQKLFVFQAPFLPEIKDPQRDFKDHFVDLAENAMRIALVSSGQPGLASASVVAGDALRWISKKFNRCGAVTNGNPPDGPPIKQDQQGRHVIRYFVEEQNGEPVLPKVEGSSTFARRLLEPAFGSWELFLKLDVVRTWELNDANLIVTGRPMGSDDLLALTDIGPPGGLNGTKPVQLRMVFDLNETYDKRVDFEACAAHELGHAMGIRHRDVTDPSNQLMNGTLTNVSMPQKLDLQAAINKGWLIKG